MSVGALAIAGIKKTIHTQLISIKVARTSFLVLNIYYVVSHFLFSTALSRMTPLAKEVPI
jgi:hypothetical protein